MRGDPDGALQDGPVLEEGSLSIFWTPGAGCVAFASAKQPDLRDRVRRHGTINELLGRQTNTRQSELTEKMLVGDLLAQLPAQTDPYASFIEVANVDDAGHSIAAFILNADLEPFFEVAAPWSNHRQTAIGLIEHACLNAFVERHPDIRRLDHGRSSLGLAAFDHRMIDSVDFDAFDVLRFHTESLTRKTRL